MPITNKNQPQLLPQKTFIAVAVIAHLLNVAYSITLVVRVYSTKQIWLSPFLVMSITEILLPIALLAISYLILRKQMHGLSLKFAATLLAFIGMLLNLMLIQLYYLPMPSFGMWSLQVLAAVNLLITGLAIILIASKSNRQNSPKLIRRSFIGLTIGIYALQAIFIVKDAIWRYTNGHELSQLPLDTTLTHGLILPLIFFIAAYLLFTKTSQHPSKLLVTTVYSVIGFLITIGLTSLWMIATQIPPHGAIDYDMAMGVVVPAASVVIYLAIIFSHKRRLAK